MNRGVKKGVAFCSALLVAVLAFPASVTAGVRVDIGVALPPLVIMSPPPLIVVPGTRVYYPPAIGVDIFFYNGYWYRPHLGRWFIAGHFNGPWSFIAVESVPVVLLRLPPVRHHVLPDYGHSPYGGFRKHRGHGRGRGWDDD